MRLLVLMLGALQLLSCKTSIEEESSGLFEADLITTDLYEFSSTFSPDGNLFFYTLSSPNYYIYEFTIVYSKKIDGQWTIPEVAPFSGIHSDRDPYFSPDGNYIYFSSMRPLNDESKKDFDLWRVKFSNERFEFDIPENLGPNVNSAQTEMSPAVDGKGNLYYAASIPNNTFGSLDIYKSEWVNNQFQKPENMGGSINSEGPDAYPYIFPSGNALFFSSRREGGLGDMDIYYSKIDEELRWEKSLMMNNTVNSIQSDISPFVFDGSLYFSSTKQNIDANLTSIEDWNKLTNSILNGNGNIYKVSLSKSNQVP